MEEASLRFPNLIEQILEKVNTPNLAKCRKVNIFWQKIIENTKELSTRKIQTHTNCSQKSVKRLARKKKKEDLKGYA